MSKEFSDIFSQLKDEHETVKKILKKAENAPASERKALLENLEQELVPHARAEEKTLYASLLAASEGRDEDARELTNEAYEEHLAVDTLMSDLKGVDVTSEAWLAKWTVIKENIEHHIKEEENDLFQHARQCLEKERLERIHEDYQEAKERFSETLPTQKQIDAKKAFAPNY